MEQRKEGGSTKTPPLLVTPRDYEIFAHLARVRLLTTQQLAALVAPELAHDRPIARRLTRLAAHGLVAKPRFGHTLTLDPRTGRILGRSKPAYGLTNRGARRLYEQTQDEDLWRTDWSKGLRALKTHAAHSAMIADVYVALHRGLGPGRTPNMQLSAWRYQGRHLHRSFWTDSTGRQLKRPLPAQVDNGTALRYNVEPDSFFSIRRTETDAELSCFLEADRSTMSRQRFLAKVRAYLLWRRLGLHAPFGSDFVVLTVTRSAQRRDSLRAAAADELGEDESSARLLFAHAADYETDPKRFVQAIWYAPGTSTRPRSLFQ